jgi:hypothetical protein
VSRTFSGPLPAAPATPFGHKGMTCGGAVCDSAACTCTISNGSSAAAARLNLEILERTNAHFGGHPSDRCAAMSPVGLKRVTIR